MGLKVFVTRELFPFTAGGIGRVVANILMTTPAEERASMAVMYVGDSITEEAFALAHPGVTLLAWPQARYERVDAQGRIYPACPDFDHSYLHWESVHVFQGLMELERKFGALDYIEFVDWGAQAFASTQEKLLGNAFGDTTLAVRLHTTDSILADFEPRAPSVHGFSLHDLERKALADCDLIVGQVASVAEAFRVFYGFEHAKWNARLHLHAPPVLLDTIKPAAASVVITNSTPLLFTSKLQDIKRPDVFIRGCVQFMRTWPAYQGQLVFLAHSFDAAYQAQIRRLIPDDLKSRVVFAQGVTGVMRESRIAQSVCIFPSPWESFCLAAYEASLSGAVCVLNAANPAFGAGTPWHDGQNCITFDGSAEDLGRALIRLFANTPAGLVPVTLPADLPPWSGLRTQRRPDKADTPAALSVVVLNRDSGGALLETVHSILASSAAVDRLVVVDDASSDPRDRAALRQLEADARLRLCLLEVPVGDSVARNIGLAEVQTPLVAFIRSGDQVLPDYLAAGVRALSRQSDHDVVVGQTAVAPGGLATTGADGGVSQCRVYYGEARLAGVYENRLAPETFLIRTAVARRHAFDPVMPALGVWEMLLRACHDGTRFIVSSSVAILQPAAVPCDPAQAAALEAAGYRLMQRKRMTLGKMSIPAYVLAGRASVSHGSVGPGADPHTARQLQELLDSESVRYALALARLLQRRAPWVLDAGKRFASRLKPLYRRLAG